MFICSNACTLAEKTRAKIPRSTSKKPDFPMVNGAAKKALCVGIPARRRQRSPQTCLGVSPPHPIRCRLHKSRPSAVPVSMPVRFGVRLRSWTPKRLSCQIRPTHGISRPPTALPIPVGPQEAPHCFRNTAFSRRVVNARRPNNPSDTPRSEVAAAHFPEPFPCSKASYSS